MQNNRARRFSAASFYFIFYAAGACLFPFLTLFYAERGLSGTQIGFVSALPPIVGLIASPFWTALADRSGKHKRIFVLTMLGSILAPVLILIFDQWSILIAIIIFFSFVSAPVMPLMDNETMQMLGKESQQYGRIRMWGAIGWGVSAPVLGSLIERYGLDWSFLGYAILISIGLLISLGLKFSSGSKVSSSFGRGMKHLLKNPNWLLFLFVVFFISICLSVISNYMFLYMDQLGIGKGTMGVAVTMATISEIPVLYFTDRLLKRLGAFNLMLLALIFVGLRVLLLSFAGEAYVFFIIQLLHGLSFSLSWTAGVTFVNEIAPEGLTATAQGLYTAVQSGVGAAVGAILGGWLFQMVGPVQMYRLFAIMVGLAIPVFYMVYQTVKKNQKGILYGKTV